MCTKMLKKSGIESLIIEAFLEECCSYKCLFTGGVNLNVFVVLCTVVLLSKFWMILGPEIHDLVLTFISVRFSE